LIVDLDALDHNITTMAAARPGPACRPHVKAFKSTAMARYVRDLGGHRGFCVATLGEAEGLVAEGLGEDVLLANETLNSERLGALVAAAVDRAARITVAVDSPETIAVATTALGHGPLDVLIDVNVGLPRCGCPPEAAERLAEQARAAGLTVRGVMGYEGHVVGNAERAWRAEQVGESMALLRVAASAVGGELVSAGGTGTFDLHDLDTEVQAGSYLLMDTAYAQLGLPFRQAVFVDATVISVNRDGYAVADAGLKAFGMDHGDPSLVGRQVFFLSDEHVTFTWDGSDPAATAAPHVGDRVTLIPAHVDPTVALHEHIWVVRGDNVTDRWDVDLRNW
jgi:D-serine deaminase-like pyridoxal phosphate-dependent protein